MTRLIRKADVDNLTNVIRYNKRGSTDSLGKFEGEKDKVIKGS